MPSVLETLRAPKEQSREVSVHAEANVWKERHPEFFVCPKNSTLMISWLNDHDLPASYANFDRAYAALSSEGKLFVPNATAFAQMTSDEALSLAQQNGIPRYDHRGKVVGYDWPEEFSQLPQVETANSPRRRRRSEMDHPEDLDGQPTKRQWAMWGADRQRQWMEATGVWGHALPEFLR